MRPYAESIYEQLDTFIDLFGIWSHEVPDSGFGLYIDSALAEVIMHLGSGGWGI